MVKQRTPPRATVLHAPIHNTPIFLTGRRSLMGYPGHIWTHGIDSGPREAEIKRIYEGAPDAPAFICIRKDNGNLVWKDNSPGKDILYYHFASPLVVEIDGKAQAIVPQSDGWLRSFDPETGAKLWEFDVNPKAAIRSRTCSTTSGVGCGFRTMIIRSSGATRGRAKHGAIRVGASKTGITEFTKLDPPSE